MVCNFETEEGFRMQHYEVKNIILKVQFFSSEKTGLKELS